MNEARTLFQATLLANGQVLVAGGPSSATAELYDPASGTWSLVASMNDERASYTATFLPDGHVLAVGGSNGNVLASAELYDVGLGFDTAWQPQITNTEQNGSSVTLTGSLFQGVSQASGGNGAQDSSSNYPIVQLRSLTNEQVAFLPVDPATVWSDTAFTSRAIAGFPPGPTLVTVFTNGIPSLPGLAAGYYLNFAPATILGNVSTRLLVQTGNNVLIGGIIITGAQPRKILFRAIGPSLGNANPPVPGVLADPILELHSATATLATNDNWMDAPNKQEIIDSTLAPTDDKESAILMTLNPGAYTAIVRGVNDTTGIALVEAYDLDTTPDARMANISTRGLVETGDNVMIGGFIVSGDGTQSVIVRALGPSLGSLKPPVPGAMADPTLELHDPDGTTFASNDNWRDTQEAEITATGLAPTNDLESAIVTTLPPAGFTAIVSGANGTTGIALVEVYSLTSP
jgi:hypothetical protein